jgi:[ribosomal protein S5]-alanine N-acetyltransferase
MILETKNLLLREFTINDLEAFAQILSKEEVMRFSLSGPLKKEQAKDYLQKRILDHYLKYGYGLYAVLCKADQKLIGLVGLITQVIDGEEIIELGYRLDPGYWGKGYATEAGEKVLQFAFEVLKTDRVISIIDPRNIRSLKVAERIGMTYWKDHVFHGFEVKIYVLTNKCN